MTRSIMLFFIALQVLSGLAPASAEESESRLPAGFVYLRKIDSTIIQDIRYATPINFTGAKVPGYMAAECLLLREVAVALKSVQDELHKNRLSLKVYDCYRPQRAVSAFLDWAKNPDAKSVDRFFPRTPRTDLVQFGYIAAVSSHSKGTAVDVTIVPLPRKPTPPIEVDKAYGSCIAPKVEREPDESLDMGTSYDCFDLKSRNPTVLELLSKAKSTTPQEVSALEDPTKLVDITEEQYSNRELLTSVMMRHGFKGISTEWWHFSYVGIERQLLSQNFPVTAAFGQR